MSPDSPPGAPAANSPLCLEESRRKSDQAGIVRSAGVVSAAVFFSRITGLVREVVFARYFGASMVYDAYLAAFRIPNLARDLLAEGALSAAFVTTFSQYLSQRSRDEAHRLANRLTTVLVPFVAFLCVAGVVFAPQIVDLMFPGFAEVEGKRELTVFLARIMAPFLLFIAMAAKAMGVLNASGVFGLPSLGSACFNVVSVGSGLVLGFFVGPRLGFDPIAGMALGTLLGGAAQYAMQIPSLRRVGLRFQPEWNLRDPGLAQVLRLMGPAVIGAAAVQVNVVVNSNFASQITDGAGVVIDGPVSWLGYAFRFMQLPLGLFGVAIAQATLPAISRSAGAGRIDDFRDTLSRSLGLTFLLTIPSAAGLIVLSRPMVGVVYQHGEFTAYDTEQTAWALSCYSLGLAGYAAIKVLTPAFYALNDVRAPMAVSLVSIGLNYTFNWTMVRVLGWGHGGLALSTSFVAILNFLMLFLILRRKIGGVEGRRIRRGLLQVSFASAAMGALVLGVLASFEDFLGDGFAARLATLAVSLPLGAVSVYKLCRWMDVRELDLAEEALLARFRRRGRS